MYDWIVSPHFSYFYCQSHFPLIKNFTLLILKLYFTKSRIIDFWPDLFNNYYQQIDLENSDSGSRAVWNIILRSGRTCCRKDRGIFRAMLWQREKLHKLRLLKMSDELNLRKWFNNSEICLNYSWLGCPA